MRVLVTGGCGFIGSNFIHFLLAERPDWEVVNLDKLTYAGNRANVADLEGHPRYHFVHGDIAGEEVVREAIERCEAVINFAAESHVDRSLKEAAPFLHTNVLGVEVLLHLARELEIERFLQISTDEVYGPKLRGASRETDRLNPRNPYSASKAGGELLARSYFLSFCLPVLITRGGNTVGPYQYPEKFVPLCITNALEDKPLPIYGDGLQRRYRIHVRDHCAALLCVLERGKPGETYNLAAGSQPTNLEVARFILNELGKPESLIQYVTDRPGHDRRYSMDWSKLAKLGWQPKYDFETAMRDTIEWYKSDEGKKWWRPIKSGEFRRYYETQYGRR